MTTTSIRITFASDTPPIHRKVPPERLWVRATGVDIGHSMSFTHSVLGRFENVQKVEYFTDDDEIGAA